MRILLVEDDPGVAQSLKSGLESECFTVDWESNGEKGSQMARINNYDAVILDNILPGKHGLQICRDIRTHGKTTPIIMLSVRSEITQKVGLLEAGADDYLVKPFSFEELLARIHAVLRRPNIIEDEILAVEDLMLNRDRYCATRGERNIYLTAKEFELLEYLMKNRGKVVSRGMIMDHVWDMNADPFSNTIETHILNLRRKIDKKEKVKLIHTIPGRGYKLDTRK